MTGENNKYMNRHPSSAEKKAYTVWVPEGRGPRRPWPGSHDARRKPKASGEA